MLAQREAEAGYDKFLSSNPEWAGKFRILQLNMMVGRGLYQSALDQIAKSPPGDFSTCELAARKHMAEATSYLKLSRYPDSAASMREAERQCATPSPDLAADLATRRGVLQGKLPLAEAEYRAALMIAREQHDTYREAGALVNLSNASQRQEHYDESIDWASASLQISRKMGYRLYEQMAVGNTAWNFYKLGDRDRALTLCTEAAQLARDLGAGGEQIRWQNNLGLLHEQSGQLQVAEADYRQALAMARQQQDANQTITALLELAFVYVQTADWGQAQKLSQAGLELAQREQNRSLELQALLEQGLIASHRGDTKTAEKLLVGVARDPDHEYKSAIWEAQGALADLYATEHKNVAANAEYEAALNTVRDARCSVHQESLRLPFFANAARVSSSYIDFLVQQSKTAEALKIADESRALTLAEGLGIEGKKCLASETAFNPQRTAREANATILFYWLGVEHSYLWAVSPDQLKLYQLPPAAQLDAPLQTYRKALTGSRDPLESGDTNGTALYQALVAPAEEFFPADSRAAAKRVIVIADGSLSGLNFETLINPKPRPHYWIEDVCVENASSLRLLAANPGKHPQTSARLLLIGDPVPPKGSEFEALPNAGKEMLSVQKYFPATAQIYQQNNSTPAAYLDSHPEQFAYIHFVAHGVASLTDPLDSAVVLSSPPSPALDSSYKLYARDVMTHPLRAQLVTVSTCKGAGVRTYTGEGLVGLSWAFLHAGAHHVIGALWDVSDESTPQLMSAMYAELVKGAPPAEALRTAKLALLRSGAPFHKPYYWAPFQLYTGT
jgi:CHAT domain-containing protein/tetratricopeptide (TPR) repeat protein